MTLIDQCDSESHVCTHTLQLVRATDLQAIDISGYYLTGCKLINCTVGCIKLAEVYCKIITVKRGRQSTDIHDYACLIHLSDRSPACKIEKSVTINCEFSLPRLIGCDS